MQRTDQYSQHVSSVVPVFKNVGEKSTAGNYLHLVFFLKLVNSLKNL